MHTIHGLGHPIQQREHPSADARGLFPDLTKPSPGPRQSGRLLERVPPELRRKAADALALPGREALRAVRALFTANLPSGAARALTELAARYVAARPAPGRLEKAQVEIAPLYVGLPFPARVAEVWPEGKGDVGKPHVTALYALVRADQLEVARDIIDRELEADLEPVQFQLGRLGYFRGGPDGDVAWVGVRDVRGGLYALRGRLLGALARGGVAYVLTHGGEFSPHATISYLEPGGTWRGHVPQGAGAFDAVEVSLNKESPRRLALGMGGPVDPSIMQKAEALLERTRGIRFGEVELGAIIGEALWDRQLGELTKGAGHKYIRKVPDGRGGWRYYYKVSGGAGGIGHADEFKVGAAFKLEHGGEAGHFHITEVGDGTITIRHDESGHEEKTTPAALRSMLHREHAELISAHKDRVHRDIAAVAVHGSAKQKARIEAEAKRYDWTRDKAHEAHGKPAAPEKRDPKTHTGPGTMGDVQIGDTLEWPGYVRNGQAMIAALKAKGLGVQAGNLTYGPGESPAPTRWPVKVISGAGLEGDGEARRREQAKQPNTVERYGRNILAGLDGYPKTYANRTQAQRAAEKFGGEVIRGRGRAFLVAIPKPSTPEPAKPDDGQLSADELEQRREAARRSAEKRRGAHTSDEEAHPGQTDEEAHPGETDKEAHGRLIAFPGTGGAKPKPEPAKPEPAKPTPDERLAAKVKAGMSFMDAARELKRERMEEANLGPGKRVIYNSPGGSWRGEITGDSGYQFTIARDDGTTTTIPKSFFVPDFTTHGSKGFPEAAHPNGAPSEREIASMKQWAMAQRKTAEDVAAAKRKLEADARAGWHEPANRNETNKRLRAVLKAIPELRGHKFSVRGSSGTGYGWVHINGATREASAALSAWGRKHGWSPSILSPDSRDKFLLFAETHAGTFVPGEGHKAGGEAAKQQAAAEAAKGARTAYRPGEVVTYGSSKRYVVTGVEDFGGGPRYHLAALSGGVRGSSGSAVDPAKMAPAPDQRIEFTGAEAGQRRAAAIGAMRRRHTGEDTHHTPEQRAAALEAVTNGGQVEAAPTKAPGLSADEQQQREEAARRSADKRRGTGQPDEPAQARPEGFEAPVAFTGELTTGTTKKLGKPTWSAKHVGQVSGEQFKAMLADAKSVRGWRGRDGWTFRSEADARAFMARWGEGGAGPSPTPPTGGSGGPGSPGGGGTPPAPKPAPKPSSTGGAKAKGGIKWEDAEGAGEGWRAKRARENAGTDLAETGDGKVTVTHRAPDGTVTETTHGSKIEAAKVYTGHRERAQVAERADETTKIARDVAQKLHGATDKVPTERPVERTEDRAAMEARHKAELDALKARGVHDWHDEHRDVVRRQMLEAFEAGHGPTEQQIRDKVNALSARHFETWGGKRQARAHREAWKLSVYRDMQRKARAHRVARDRRDRAVAPATTRVKAVAEALYNSGQWRDAPPKVGELVADTRLNGNKSPMTTLEVHAAHDKSVRTRAPAADFLGHRKTGDKRDWRGLGMPYEEALHAAMRSISDDDLRQVARWNGSAQWSPASHDGGGYARHFAVQELERRQKAGTFNPPPDLGERRAEGGQPIAGKVKPGDIARTPPGTTVNINGDDYVRHHAGTWSKVTTYERNDGKGLGTSFDREHHRTDDFERMALEAGASYSNRMGYPRAEGDHALPTPDSLRAERAAKRAAREAERAKVQAENDAADKRRNAQLRALVSAPVPARGRTTDYAAAAKAAAAEGRSDYDRRLEHHKGRVAIVRSEGRYGGPTWEVHEHLPDGKVNTFSHPLKRDAVQHMRDLEAAHAKIVPHTEEHLDLAHELEHLASLANRSDSTGRSLWTDAQHGGDQSVANLANDMKRAAKVLRTRLTHGSADSRHMSVYGGYAKYRQREGAQGHDAPRPYTAEQLADTAERARHMIDRFKATADGSGRHEWHTHNRPDGVYGQDTREAWANGFTFKPGTWQKGDEDVLPWQRRAETVAALKRAGLRPVPHGKFSVHPDKRHVVGATKAVEKSAPWSREARGRSLLERAEALLAKSRRGAA